MGSKQILMYGAVFSSGQDAKHLQQDTFNTSSVFVYIPAGIIC